MTEPLPPDRHVAIGYAPASLRPAFAALLALDARFAGIVRTTREPIVGQMRLTWWRDALERLDHAAAPAEPLLRRVQADVLPHGIAGADLAALVEGWEVLLDPLDADALDRHGEGRGVGLFALAGRTMGGDGDTLRAAGRGWALADLAAHVSRTSVAEQATAMARQAFAQGFSKTWPASLRPIGALALLQALRIEGEAPLRDFMRLTRFRMIGR